jgi:hypothetical protein
MHLTRLLALPLAPLALLATTSPASAIIAGKPVTYSIHGDGSACFSASPGGPATGLATASGVETLRFNLAPLEVLPRASDLLEGVAAPQDQPFAAAVPLVTTGSPIGVCLGGGGTGWSGTATYTFDLHGTTGDYVAVVTCTFKDGVPACT